MKIAVKIIVTALILWLCGNPIQSQHDHNFQIEQDFEAVIKSEREAHLGKTNAASSLTIDYDIKYHRLEWRVDPAVYYIRGAITTYFEPLTPGFQAIHFDMSDSLVIDSVLYHDNLLSFSNPEPDVIKIDLPAPVNAMDSVTLYYQGMPPSTGFGSFVQDTHDGAPIIWTLSEPYGAKDWWPCKQILSDKIDSVDVIVRTPSGNRVASNGLLVQEGTDGQDKIYHWKHRYPIPAYLIAISVTNYVVFSNYVHFDDGADSIEVLNYVFPEDLTVLQGQSTRLIAMMELYNDLFGLYPFSEEKYGHAQFGWGGGMEHQTMSFMGGFSYGLLSHELAHQWFGNKVTCGSWHDIWLNEGFATYLTGLYWEAFNQPTWALFKSNRIDQVTGEPGGSTYVTDTTDVGRIFDGRLSYSKGALILHMLRWVVGDDVFFQACRNYLNDPDLAFSYAVTDDLKDHLEAQSGLDLTGFFADWYYGEGYPSYDISWSQVGETVDLSVGQVTSHPSVDFFEMPVPVQFIGQGQDSVVVFDHTFSGQMFTVNLPFQVQTVVFDPDLWIISRDNTINSSTPVFQQSNVELEVSVFPNPAHDKVLIRFHDSSPWIDEIDIFNSIGEWVASFPSPGPHFTTELDVSGFPSGMYLLYFRLPEGGQFVRKILVD